MARRRLLEGFLLRLAAVRDADAFALRGGMLVHQWLPEARRSIGDVDLVCALPYCPRDLRHRLHEVLRRDAGDGVVFDADRFRLDQMMHGGRRALELFASGRVDGAFAEITVDFTFELDVWPAATRSVLAAERGSAMLWTCAPEMVVATKLGVIAELGQREWRPKDLADIWIVLRRFPPSPLIGETFERRLGAAHAGVAILASSWWHEGRAAMRWARQTLVPGELDVVLAEVRDKLAPL
jgi:Nucleotidyl transferase AbiEii toxin, Type IV TA system